MDHSIIANSENLARLGRSDPSLRVYTCPATVQPLILATALRRNNTLRALKLSGVGQHRPDAELVEVLTTLPLVTSLRTLDISDASLSPTSLSAVAEYVQRAENLTRLDLSHNVIPQSSIESLVHAMACNKTLQNLSLASCRTSVSVFLAALLETQKPVCPLSRLDLSYNDAPTEAMALLCRVTTSFPTLEFVEISGNHVLLETRQSLTQLLASNRMAAERERVKAKARCVSPDLMALQMLSKGGESAAAKCPALECMSNVLKQEC